MSSQRLKPEERRRTLLDLGMGLFGKRSFEAVSITDICAAAGISRPLFEHYFGTKKSYYVACVAHALDHIEQITRQPAVESSFADLETYLENMFSFLRKHPQSATLLENAGGVSEAERLIDDFNDGTTQAILETVPEHLQSTEVRTAIECWHGVNSKLIAQLINRPTITVQWAAAYSSNMLKSLITEASNTVLDTKN